MSISLEILEVGSGFVVNAKLPDGTERVVMSSFYEDGPNVMDSDENSRESKLEGIRAYIHGMADGMNLMRSLTPTVTYNSNIRKV